MKATPDWRVRAGTKGGRVRARRLTAKQLSAIGRKGARARWGKQKRA